MSPLTYEPIRHPEIKSTQLFINNKFVNALDNATLPVENPVNEEVIANVQAAGEKDVDLAVAAAKQAMERGSQWRTMDASARGNLLNKVADIVERDAAYIASLETLDNGKPFPSALGNIKVAVAQFRYSAGWCDKIEGRTIPADGNKFVYTRYEPVGVVGAITPWNFPFVLAVKKLAQALCTGNAIVLKPPEQTPLTCIYFGNIVLEAGFPPGVVNIVTGYGRTAGNAISYHPDIDKVTFTGSSLVGHLIQKASGESNLKRVTLELGGKSPLIVCPSADIDKAVEMAQNGCYVNMGQTCTAMTRTFVHESIYDEFVQKTAARAKALAAKVGDPFEAGIAHGPQVNKPQFDKILELIKSGTTDGAKLECGGKRMFEKGYFIEPTVFSNVTDEMRIAKEEIFGPVQQLLKFSTIDEAITRANNTTYGLAATVLTNDVTEAITISSGLQAGNVFVNQPLTNTCQTPFGGFKQSGIGRENGWEGLLPYLEVKTVFIALPTKC